MGADKEITDSISGRTNLGKDFSLIGSGLGVLGVNSVVLVGTYSKFYFLLWDQVFGVIVWHVIIIIIELNK